MATHDMPPKAPDGMWAEVMGDAAGEPRPADEYDIPWKEAIEGAFPEFMAFYFPAAHDAIDWPQGHEFLDKELHQVVRDAASGKKFVDLLVRVMGRDAAERLLYVHVEVQLYEQGWERQRVIDLFAIIDWMLTLPKPLEQQVWQEIEDIERKSQMKYVTSVERLAIERGHMTGRLEGKLEGRLEGKLETLTRQLTRRFGPLPEWVAERLIACTGEQLDAWSDRVLDAATLAEVFGGH